MSFPYRLLMHITSNPTAQLITLRLLDVAIVAVGFYVFRRLLLRLGMSRAATQALLWIVILLPMTPFLAGQLTYDTLWFTMTAVTLLATVKLVDTVQNRRILPLRDVSWTIALLLLTSQVKYAFLPMALAGTVFLVVFIAYRIRAHSFDVQRTLDEWRSAIHTPLTIGAVTLLLVSGVFFGARYGTNIVKYHNPVPACATVLGKQDCLAYGPYARDESNRDMALDKQLKTSNKVSYPFGWFFQMMRESYFAVGPLDLDYPTGVPLPVSYWTGFGVAIISIGLIVTRAKQLWQNSIHARLLITSVLTYVVFLFATNFQAYLSTGEPVAIHGRYVLALLPMLGYLVYVALRSIPSWRWWRTYVIAFVAVFIILTTYGGGIAPFILRSADNWYWPAAVPTSKIVRSVLWPIIIR